MIYLSDQRLYNSLASVGSLSSNPSKNIFYGLTIVHKPLVQLVCSNRDRGALLVFAITSH